MEQRHDRDDHVLCVVSDDYLKAPYSTLERNAALWQAASTGGDGQALSACIGEAADLAYAARLAFRVLKQAYGIADFGQRAGSRRCAVD